MTGTCCASVKAFGLTFRGLDVDNLLADSEGLRFVVTVNADFVSRSETDLRLAQLISGNIATLDGQIVYWLAKLQNPNCEFSKISGSDFVYRIASVAAAKGRKLFLLGGSESANSQSVQRLAADFGVSVDGYSPPHLEYPFTPDVESEIMRRIADFGPHYLCVGFGSPKQEFWIDDHRVKLEAAGVSLVVGVGGALDFISGNIKRAPRWVQSVGLEGVYRLISEPNIMRLKRILSSFKVFGIFLRRWH
jgi:N-acetylglucosaminyldiphosphoundecaprenol N-acetyl-beta-D-mannosaminyltransferase